ncbi:MAG: hypothetical protein ACI4PM_00755 [Butyricicoccus sp.]
MAFAKAPIKDKDGNAHVLYADNVDFAEDGSVKYTTKCTEHFAEKLSNDTYKEEADVTVKQVIVAPDCENDGYFYYVATIYGDEFTSPKYYTNQPHTDGHKSTGEVYYKNNTATCTKAGTATQYEICAYCGKEINAKTIDVAALGHDYQLTGTDTEMGDPVYKCTVCGDKFVGDRAHEHQDKALEAVVTKYPTCTEDGEKVIKHVCKICGVTLSVDKVTIPATNHAGAVAIKTVIDKAPTCVDEGSKTVTYKCMAPCCIGTDEQGYIFTKTETIPATGVHTYERQELSNTATCTEPGVKTTALICSVCGKEKADSREYEAVAPYKHDKTSVTKEDVVEPTCVKEGSYVSVTTCDRCGEILSKENVKVPATDEHTYEPTIIWSVDEDYYGGQQELIPLSAGNVVIGDKDVITKDAAPKFQLVDECTVCGKQIPLSGWIQGIEDMSKRVEPVYDCLGGSKTFTATIDYKGKTYTDTATFTYIGSGHLAKHQFETTTTVTTPATCTEEGVKTTETKCTVCGTVDERKTVTETIPATGHTYGEYVVTTPATYTAEGVKTKTCEDCGAEKTASIAKLTVAKQKLGYVHNVASKKMQVEFQKFAPAKGYTVKYQIRYATNSSFTKSVKNKYTVKSSKMITSLTKGKTYYVKVRTHVYDADGNEVARGKYSEVTKITIKK